MLVATGYIKKPTLLSGFFCRPKLPFNLKWVPMIYLDNAYSSAWCAYENLSDVQWWKSVYQGVCKHRHVQRTWSVISSKQGMAWGAGIAGVCVVGLVVFKLAHRKPRVAVIADPTAIRILEKNEPATFKRGGEGPSNETKNSIRYTNPSETTPGSWVAFLSFCFSRCCFWLFGVLVFFDDFKVNAHVVATCNSH